MTGLTLYIISRPFCNMFRPKRTALRSILPLALAMCFQVVLPNLSLAYSSVTFYQLARILLTPTVALLNYVLYGSTLPRRAIIPLIPACAGVAMVSYHDSQPTDDVSIKHTTMAGIFFALSGVLASSLYTVWIGYYHKELEMSSMQLLSNQAPVGAALLLYVIPWVDTAPDFCQVEASRWIMILLVCQIHLSFASDIEFV